MKYKNALARLGHALSRYIKLSPDKADKKYQLNKRNLPAIRNRHRPQHRRCQRYSEQCVAQSTNCPRTAIVNPYGLSVTVDVFSHNSALARRSYKNSERRR